MQPLLLLLSLAPAAAPPAAPSASDRAVRRALDYLHTTQQADGTWPGRRLRKAPGIDALCVMAFLSAGHAPGKGPRVDAVEKGIRAVLAAQKPTGVIAVETSLEMYHHGIATLMLAQAQTVSRGKLRAEVRKALDAAVAVILKAQRTKTTARGGWRYSVAEVAGADLSVTGWQVLALLAARDAGCKVPPAALEQALAFIRRCRDPRTGGFRYVPAGAGLTLYCTAVGIIGVSLLVPDGRRETDTLRAGAYLLRQKPTPTYSYFFLGAWRGAQAMSLLGGNYEREYRKAVVPVLLAGQSPNGSWFPRTIEQTYGPHMATALAVLALTADRQRLPPFRGREEEPPGPASDR